MTNNVIKKVYKNWVEYQIYWSAGAAGAGDVTWPSSSTNWHLAVFDWTTGKVIKDWWAVPSTADCVKTSWDQTIAWTKTFSTSPVVPSKSTDAANTATAIATEAQVYKKQDKLTTQTAYTTKWTATKVPTITTNTLWQVTAISETNITFPVTSVWWSTWEVGLKTINNNAITWSWNISVWTLTAETVVSGDSGTTYTIKVSASAPWSWTSNTTITFVTA